MDVLATLGHIVIFGFLAGVGETNLQAEAVKHFAKAPTISYSEIYATYFSDFPLVKRSLGTIYQLLAEGKKYSPSTQPCHCLKRRKHTTYLRAEKKSWVRCCSLPMTSAM
ncbi:hypothetical protein QW180_21850 [Vibrio sinaloensis]|nr:hypothetical protein [Vibrio sinaloensis]